MNYKLRNLALFTTHECRADKNGLGCRHCLVDGTEDGIHIPTNYIEQVFETFSEIDQLNIYGGEPADNINGLLDIGRLAKESKTPVRQLSLCTCGLGFDELTEALEQVKSDLDIASGKFTFVCAVVSGHSLVQGALRRQGYDPEQVLDNVRRLTELHPKLALPIRSTLPKPFAKSGRAQNFKNAVEFPAQPLFSNPSDAQTGLCNKIVIKADGFVTGHDYRTHAYVRLAGNHYGDLKNETLGTIVKREKDKLI